MHIIIILIKFSLIAHGLYHYFTELEEELKNSNKLPSLMSVCQRYCAANVRVRSAESVYQYIRKRSNPKCPMNPIMVNFEIKLAN